MTSAVQADEVFRAIADSNRRWILDLLAAFTAGRKELGHGGFRQNRLA
jgi:hypothetical protein